MTDAATLLGSARYTPQDQDRFATLSRDINPIHVDPMTARRLLTGRQVVHGVHLLLDAIELWAAAATDPLFRVECVFRNPVSVGDQVEFTSRAGADLTTVLEATVDALSCAHITLFHVDGSVPSRKEADNEASQTGQALTLDGALAQAMDEAPEAHAGRHYLLPIDGASALTAFPHCYSLLGADAVASMMALSYFVGMVCPGLHSVFSSLTLRATPQRELAGQLRFHVRKFDPRFRLFDVQFVGPISGGLQAFQRPAPQQQASMQQIAEYVVPMEFEGSRSLVIGGSRGLGELVAKILAAGGATPSSPMRVA
jgi:hypothetical protein